LFVLPENLHYRAPIGPQCADKYISFSDKPLFSNAAASLIGNISISANPRLPAPSLMDHNGWMERETADQTLGFDALDAQERMDEAHERSACEVHDFREAEIDCLVDFLPDRLRG
jgi:hypothetical protein